MPNDWSPETYRRRARQWQDKAAALPSGDERQTCEALAEGYMRLAQLIEKDLLTARAGELRRESSARRRGEPSRCPTFQCLTPGVPRRLPGRRPALAVVSSKQRKSCPGHA
jgi:hypothetical protein